MRTPHLCPNCGLSHYPPIPEAECLCGHLSSNHDDNGGRRKKAPCTVWDPDECPCEDYTE